MLFYIITPRNLNVNFVQISFLMCKSKLNKNNLLQDRVVSLCKIIEKF